MHLNLHIKLYICMFVWPYRRTRNPTFTTFTSCTRAGQIAARATALARADNPHYGCAFASYRDILLCKVKHRLAVGKGQRY